jgi:hypothetical protein
VDFIPVSVQALMLQHREAQNSSPVYTQYGFF